MSIDQDREYYFLKQLLDAPGQTLKKFPGTKARPAGLDLDGPTKKIVETRLINNNHIAVNGKGKDKAFTITDAGRQYFPSLPIFPPPVSIDPKFKAFVLLTLLTAGDGHMTLKQVKALTPAGVLKKFDAAKDALPALVDALVKEQLLEPSTREGQTADERLNLRLTEAGGRALVGLGQHPDLEFKLKGAAINRLIEFAGCRPVAAERQPAPVKVSTDHQAQNLLAMMAGESFSDEELIRDAKSLMATRGANGMLPIFELRRHVKRRFGERAAGFEEFDKRLKRLRGDRLDLISLFDTSAFSHDQITEGVQGAGELFFYVRNLR